MRTCPKCALGWLESIATILDSDAIAQITIQITIQRSFLGHSSFRQITLQCPWARAEKSIYTKTTLDRYSLSLDYAERAILERGNPGSVPGCFICPSQYTSRGNNDPEITIQRGFLGRL
jgi:hypothetical protein